ncbi:hypothetical protein VTK73DRAFT_4304 [Phialemonium thermophilum]|uniref:Uncharacterized protein n=1 Tax=Phialemonium thermophilum TaxID=223376 RepID=A0ABR3VAP4_9PEZI
MGGQGLPRHGLTQRCAAHQHTFCMAARFEGDCSSDALERCRRLLPLLSTSARYNTASASSSNIYRWRARELAGSILYDEIADIDNRNEP